MMYNVLFNQMMNEKLLPLVDGIRRTDCKVDMAYVPNQAAFTWLFEHEDMSDKLLTNISIGSYLEHKNSDLNDLVTCDPLSGDQLQNIILLFSDGQAGQGPGACGHLYS